MKQFNWIIPIMGFCTTLVAKGTQPLRQGFGSSHLLLDCFQGSKLLAKKKSCCSLSARGQTLNRHHVPPFCTAVEFCTPHTSKKRLWGEGSSVGSSFGIHAHALWRRWTSSHDALGLGSNQHSDRTVCNPLMAVWSLTPTQPSWWPGLFRRALPQVALTTRTLTRKTDAYGHARQSGASRLGHTTIWLESLSKFGPFAAPYMATGCKELPKASLSLSLLACVCVCARGYMCV